MNSLFHDHEIIAGILNKKSHEMPCQEWVETIEKPLRPFYQAISARIMSLSPNLHRPSFYSKPGKAATRQRQCFMRGAWHYEYKKPLPQAQNLSVIVQLSDFEEICFKKLFWCLNWYGSAESVPSVRILFERVKNGAPLFAGQNTMGAFVSYVRVIPHTYTAEQLLSLQHDIKDEIINDIAKIVTSLDALQQDN